MLIRRASLAIQTLSTLLDIVELVKGYMNRFNQAQLITEPELCTAVFCQALRDMSMEDRINDYLKLKIIFLHYENEVQKVYRIFTLKSNSQVHVLTTVIQNPPPPPPTFWEKIKRCSSDKDEHLRVLFFFVGYVFFIARIIIMYKGDTTDCILQSQLQASY